MPGLLSDFLLLLWVLVSVLSIGIALCLRFTQFKGIELIGYGTGAGVLVHGLFGLLIAVSWHLRHVTGVFPICAAAVAIWFLIRRRALGEILSSLSRPLRLALLGWLVLLLLGLTVVRVTVVWPDSLKDGAYVFKKHSLNVKIQYLTTQPADNFIPYVVTEFFHRGISFKKEHPLLPLNEVSNRTVLMSLVVLPFRTVLGWHQRREKDLGTFTYVGKQWPAVERLNEDDSYNQFYVVGMFLNSLMLLGLIVLFANFEFPAFLPGGALLYLTSPYFLSQTIFTWPKAMAAFFVFLTWNSARQKHDPRFVALCAALAYHSHPASLPIAASLGLWYAIGAWRAKSGFRPVYQYALVFFLAVLPWFAWTRLFLQLPDNMLALNFSGPGTFDPFAAPLDFFWVRVSNFAVSIAPASLMVSPFSAEEITNYAIRCIPMAVGLIVVIPAFLECVSRWTSERMLLLYGLLLPALATLSLFSVSFPPVLLGWQPMVGILLFLGVNRLRRSFSPLTYRVLLTLQVIINLAVMALRGSLVGAHFS